jgi:anti-anti-sigma factor
MEIQEQSQDGVLVMRISGQIDSTSGPMLGTRLDTLIGEGNVHLVLDLSKVPYISSAGLRVLSIALKAVRTPEVDGDLCLASLSKTVAHAFRISGFNQVFSIYDTESEAITAAAASKQPDADW